MISLLIDHDECNRYYTCFITIGLPRLSHLSLLYRAYTRMLMLWNVSILKHWRSVEHSWRSVWEIVYVRRSWRSTTNAVSELRRKRHLTFSMAIASEDGRKRLCIQEVWLSVWGRNAIWTTILRLELDSSLCARSGPCSTINLSVAMLVKLKCRYWAIICILRL